MRVFVGVEIGQKRNQTAICVAEQECREVDQRKETHYLVRHLERMPLASSYPAVATRVGEIVTRVKERTDIYSTIFVNATGTGVPVINLIAEQAREREVIWPVYFNYGDRRKEESETELQVTLGKAYLVTRLQTLLQTDRLHLSRTSESEALAQELLDYEVKVDEHANERYGAFSVGTHDDLVMALGLAVQVDCPNYPRYCTIIMSDMYRPIEL
jgi:hypothetical protein